MREQYARPLLTKPAEFMKAEERAAAKRVAQHES